MTSFDHAFSAGGIYAFPTISSDFADRRQTGRWAAFKVIGAEALHYAVAVIDGAWDRPPAIAEVRGRPLLRERRFDMAGRVAAYGVSRDLWKPEEIEGLRQIGAAPLSWEEKTLAADIARLAIGTRFTTLKAVNFAAEGEWRWANDREAFVAEVERRRAEQEAKRAAEQERYRTRLRGLTVERLLAETPFERWSVPPPEFTAAAREAVREACRRVRDLGPKPRKGDVRAALRDCVLWFNRADEEAGGVIETDEREDIFAALEEIAHAARQPSLAREIDGWRDW